jgi:radical SAM superfamily enzyme YgiQ (UPF0313 family)
MKVLLFLHELGMPNPPFNLGMGYLASSLRKENHNVTIYNQDVFHYSMNEASEFIKKEHFDMIGIGGFYSEYRTIIRLCKLIKESSPSSLLVLGGPIVTPLSEMALKLTKADIAVRGEGEETIIEIAKALEGMCDFAQIKGISYRDDAGNIHSTEDRQLVMNISSLPWPAYELFPMDKYIHGMHDLPFTFTQEGLRGVQIISSRGCPYRCNFCYQLNKKYRIRDVNELLDEMAFLMEKFGIFLFYFQDDLFLSSKKRIKEFAESLEKYKMEIYYVISGRYNIMDQEILEILKSSGCLSVTFGLESGDPEILKMANKKIDIKQVRKINNLCRKIQIDFQAAAMFGNIRDDRNTLFKTIKLMMETNDGNSLRNMITICQPFPKSELYVYAKEKRMFKDELDFFKKWEDNWNLNFNFTSLTNQEFLRAFWEASLLLAFDASIKAMIISAYKQIIEVEKTFWAMEVSKSNFFLNSNRYSQNAYITKKQKSLYEKYSKFIDFESDNFGLKGCNSFEEMKLTAKKVLKSYEKFKYLGDDVQKHYRNAVDKYFTMLWAQKMKAFPAIMPRDFVFPWKSLFYETLENISIYRSCEDSLFILKQIVDYLFLQGEHYYESTLALSLIINKYLDTDLDKAIKSIVCALKIHRESYYLKQFHDYLREARKFGQPVSQVRNWLAEKGQIFSNPAKYLVSALEEEFTYKANFTYSPQLLCKIANKIIKRKKTLGEKKFAIYGTGGHTETFLSMCNTSSLDLICFIKSSPREGEYYQNLPVFSPNYIKNIEIDFVLISSAPYEKEMFHLLQSETVDRHCNIQPIYGSLEAKEVEDWGGI